MDPIVFIDSLDNISIVNLNVPSLSPDHIMTDNSIGYESSMTYDLLTIKNNSYNGSTLLSSHLEDDEMNEHRLQFDIIEEPQEVIHSTFKSHNRRTTSSLDKVRTWKKYKNKKHLSQLELDRKRDLANKQERRRMHRLNDALNKLRQVIPPDLQHPPRRLSKIKTLQSAIKYIKKLQEMLEN